MSANIGSGPFIWNAAEAKPGAQYVYDKNPKYVPRNEPSSGLAGGKIVKLERVIWENIGDQQTAMAALQAGEIDFYEIPPIDLLGQLESDPNIKVDVFDKGGNIVILRMNFLHPPFNEVKARQATAVPGQPEGLHEGDVRRSEILRHSELDLRQQHAIRERRKYRLVPAGVDLDKARQLFKESGYNGEPVVVLQATNFAFMSNSEQLIAAQLRKIGVNAATGAE